MLEFRLVNSNNLHIGQTADIATIKQKHEQGILSRFVLLVDNIFFSGYPENISLSFRVTGIQPLLFPNQQGQKLTGNYGT